MKSRTLEPGTIDALYQPAADVWVQAERPPVEVAGVSLPSRYVLAYERDLFSSVMDVVESRDRLLDAGPQFRIRVARELSDLLAGALRDMADRTRAWAEGAEEYPRDSGRERWAEDTARVVGLLYRIDRGRAAADPREAYGSEMTQLAALAPVIRSLIVVLTKRMELETGEGALLGELGDQRSLPLEFLLRGAFRLARLQMPPDAPAEVLDVFDHGPPTAVGVENVVRRRLLDLRRQAEEGRRPPANERMAQYLKALPYLFSNMARLIEQWDKFYLVGVEIGRQPGGEIFSLVIDVQAGQVVRMDAIHPMAPLVTFEGRTRINFWEPGEDGREKFRIQTVDERGGRIALRFESWVYGLASLFTFPIEDWALEEMTVTTARPERHRKETTIELLMLARQYRDADDDRRRVIRIHTTRQLSVTTTGDMVDRRVIQDTRFEYYRPGRMWYYDRSSSEALPKP